MNIGLELVSTNKEIEAEINKIVFDEFRRYIKKILPKLDVQLKTLIYNTLRDSFEVEDLLNGKLKSEIGLTSTENVLRVLEKAASLFQIRATNKGLTVEILDQTYAELLAMPEARYITDKGEILDWLEWLLLAGDRVIVRDYEVQRNPRKSRTNDLIMVKRPGSGWSVPPENRGTADNNFITRALENIDEKIDILIESNINGS